MRISDWSSDVCSSDLKVAVITGGDSGIGRAIAIAYAKEGADIVIAYLDEHEDAEKTRQLIEGCGCQCVALAGDVGDEAFCRAVIEEIGRASCRERVCQYV